MKRRGMGRRDYEGANKMVGWGRREGMEEKGLIN